MRWAEVDPGGKLAAMADPIYLFNRPYNEIDL